MKKIFGIYLLTLSIIFSGKAYQNLTPQEFYKEIETKKDVLLIDVRTPMEYEKDGHIKGSKLIPIQVFAKFLPNLENYKDKEIFVYCRSGSRSSVVSRFLDKMGFKKVYNLQGGIIQWKNNKLPVEYGK
jgi:rhodanese-related sulfurtransferase